MEAEKKRNLLHGVVGKMMAGGKDINTSEWPEFVETQNDGLRTGPEIGAKVPDFILPDQAGRLWSLKDLMGRNGLMLAACNS
jgi:hypothetical protein